MNKLILKVIFIISLIGLIGAVTVSRLQTSNIPQEVICKDCNVVLITMTRLRYDHMSSNGYFRLTTPNLDKLAKESLVFDNAFSHTSWTLPEAISIYTSLYPFQHSVMNRYDGSKLSKKTPTLLDVLKKAGYKTAAFTGGTNYEEKHGLTSRFDTYQQCFKGPEGSLGEFSCTMPKALDWLKAQTGNKFFLHVQGFDVHCPYTQASGLLYDKNYKGTADPSYCIKTIKGANPRIIDGQTYWVARSDKDRFAEFLLQKRDIDHLVALYDEAITYTDQLVGNFIEELRKRGLWDKTIIIFTSEHGTRLGGNSRSLLVTGVFINAGYDSAIHIPLIIKHPNLPPKRINDLAAHIDLTPTILSFLGLTAGFKMEGKNLTPLIVNNRQVNSEIFAGATGTSFLNPTFEKTQLAVIRDMNWKMIARTILRKSKDPETTVELYDIINDKEEAKNLADTRADISAKLKGKLQKWLKRTGAYVIK